VSFLKERAAKPFCGPFRFLVGQGRIELPTPGFSGQNTPRAPPFQSLIIPRLASDNNKKEDFYTWPELAEVGWILFVAGTFWAQFHPPLPTGARPPGGSAIQISFLP